MKPKAFFVVSNYKNDISWIKNYTDNFCIFDKSGELPESENIFKIENVGFNIYDICSFNYYNYENLPEIIAFLQGHPWNHICRETFDKLIYNECFTPLEDYSHIPESLSHKKDIDGGYLERHSNWFLNLDPPYKHRWYTSYIEFIDDMLIGVPPMSWIRLCPGAQYIVPRENILKYSKNFWGKLMGTVSYDRYPMEAHLIERALYTIFIAKFEERKL